MNRTSLLTIPVILLILLTAYSFAIAMMGGGMGDSSNNHMGTTKNMNNQQGYHSQQGAHNQNMNNQNMNNQNMDNQNMDHSTMDHEAGQNMADDFFKE